jgi:hypothetical protein
MLDKNKAPKEKSTNPGKTSCYWYSILKVVRYLTTQYGMSGVTIQADNKLLKVPPYKNDYKARIRYCKWFQESVFNALLDPEGT